MECFHMGRTLLMALGLRNSVTQYEQTQVGQQQAVLCKFSDAEAVAANKETANSPPSSSDLPQRGARVHPLMVSGQLKQTAGEDFAQAMQAARQSLYHGVVPSGIWYHLCTVRMYVLCQQSTCRIGLMRFFGPDSCMHASTSWHARISYHCSVAIFKGALLYTPVGWISCRKAHGIYFGLECSIAIPSDSSMTELGMIMESINKFQSSGSVKTSAQYTGMSATLAELKKVAGPAGAQTFMYDCTYLCELCHHLDVTCLCT